MEVFPFVWGGLKRVKEELPLLAAHSAGEICLQLYQQVRFNEGNPNPLACACIALAGYRYRPQSVTLL
jgi:hypothetical protein